MASKPGAIISDKLMTSDNGLVLTPVVGAVIKAVPSIAPLYEQQADNSWQLIEQPWPTSTTDATGTFSLQLPAQPNCDPNTVTWAITLPDGSGKSFTYAGVVTAAMVTASNPGTAIKLSVLKSTYSWTLQPAANSTAVLTSTLVGLGDVTITTPLTGNGLLYNGTTGRWFNTAVAVATKTSAYSAQATDDVLLCDTTTGAFTVTLPSAVNLGKIGPLRIKKIDATQNVLTIAALGGQTVDGGASITLKIPYQSVDLVSDGANFWVL